MKQHKMWGAASSKFQGGEGRRTRVSAGLFEGVFVYVAGGDNKDTQESD